MVGDHDDDFDDDNYDYGDTNDADDDCGHGEQAPMGHHTAAGYDDDDDDGSW